MKEDINHRSALQQRWAGNAIAVLLGSGWAPFAEALQDATDVPYADLPAFPALAVGGHKSLLRRGRVGDTPVAVLAGRKHAYETGNADAMLGAIRTLAAWGVQVLLQTNAAGSLHASLRPGSLMLVSDHLNLVQRSPLIGEQGDARFVDMSAAYCPCCANRRATPRGHRHAAARRCLCLCWAPVRNAGRDPMLQASRPGRRHEHGARDDHRAPRRPARAGVTMMTNIAAGIDSVTLSHAHTLATAAPPLPHATALLATVYGH